MKITIPDLRSVNTIELIKKMNEICIRGNTDIEFDFQSEWVDPLGMILCCSSIKSLREKHKDISMTMLDPTEANAADYAGHMGFFKYVSDLINIGNRPGEAPGGYNYVPITIIDFDELQRREIASGNYCELNDTIENESQKLANVLCQSDNNMKQLFSYIIREILRNTPEHSESNQAIICAQYWKNGKAEIAILDEGIGIKNSLRKNAVHREYISTDLDALESAVQPGISQAFSPDRMNRSENAWSNSGFGLYIASEICKRLDGEFWMVSGNNAIRLNQYKTTTFETSFKGTAIGIKLNASELKDSNKLISEIAINGEEIAKKNRNAFKTASEPSKSLFMR